MASEQYYKDLLRVSYGLPPQGAPMPMEKKEDSISQPSMGLDRESQKILMDTTSDVVAELAKRRRQKNLEQSLGDLSQGMEGLDTAYDSAMGTEESGTTTP